MGCQEHPSRSVNSQDDQEHRATESGQATVKAGH